MTDTTAANDSKGSGLAAKNPVREWCIYGGVLLTLFLFAAGKHIISALRTDQTGLCVFILAIFVGALVKSLLDVLYIQRQIRLTNEQIQTLWSSGNVRRFLRATEESIFRRHISNLYQIFKRDTQIDQDNLIGLLHSRLIARTKIVDLCSSILITLGLVGTIIGLILSIGGLGLVMENVGGDNQKLLTGMQGTLSGMGTAFYTTLLGAILGGVFLRILSNVVDGNLDFLVAHIAELTEIHIIPVLRRAARIREQDPDAPLEAGHTEAEAFPEEE